MNGDFKERVGTSEKPVGCVVRKIAPFLKKIKMTYHCNPWKIETQESQVIL